MSIKRLKEYANPEHGMQGATHGQASRLQPWSQRATENSAVAPRASDGKMKLPSTGGKVKTRDTSMSPITSRKIDKAMAGKDPDDLNHVGSSYMKSVRRKA
jgi:hypothetical protein